MRDYQDFLSGKLARAAHVGLDISPNDLNPVLFDWQREITAWALQVGRAALFEECGMGKTFQQLEWARVVVEHTGGSVLIVCPLAVAHQTVAEGRKIGLPVRYIRGQEEVTTPGVYITNYDMLKAFDGASWAGVVLDESSVLKPFTGKIKRMILSMFEYTPYKLACTATPAPNDHLELGNHAEFLNVLQSNEMIQRWFINDSMEAGTYRLKRHAEADFWSWVTTWAVCLSKPGDLGYPNGGFDLPELVIHEHVVGVDHTRAYAEGKLLVGGKLSATGIWREKGFTLADRVAKAREIVGDSSDYWVLWCDTDAEADALKVAFPQAIEVRGSNPRQVKEQRLQSFSDGEARMIITKPDLAGFGLNWQHCSNAVFVGVTYSFEKTYQALRRMWRYGQSRPVQAHMIYAESEGDVLATLHQKQSAHAAMQRAMNAAMSENGLGRLTDHRAKSMYTGHQPMTIPAWVYSRA